MLLHLFMGEAGAFKWAERLAHQYVRARHPLTGLGVYQYSRPMRRQEPPEELKLPCPTSPRSPPSLPPTLSRLVRCRLRIRGFRTTQIALVTTLLDTQRHPLEAFGLLYLRRWRMELAFRDLKITLHMDQLRCKTPDNLAREIRLHLLVHNL